MADRHSDPSLGLWIALRFLWNAQNRFARFVTWVSFIGLALGVMILTVVVTVMNGFDNELKSRLLRAIPHITIRGATVDHAAVSMAQQWPEVLAANNYFLGLGAVTQQGSVHPVSLYGVDDYRSADMAALAESMRIGDLDSLTHVQQGIVLGMPLVSYLDLELGDPVVVVTTEVEGERVSPKLLRFNLVGAFELGAEPDYTLALVGLSSQPRQVWQLLGRTGVQLQMSQPLQAPFIADRLSTNFPELEVATWTEEYGDLFRAVRLEKSMMFVLLLLVVAIAAFNIVAGQIMMVNDKRSDIAILRTMGATVALIRRIFLLQGVVISILGTLIGLLLGLLCAAYVNEIMDGLQALSGRHLLDGSFFVEIPTLVLISDLLLIAAISGLLCLLSAWLPARRAALIDPVEGLHR